MARIGPFQIDGVVNVERHAIEQAVARLPLAYMNDGDEAHVARTIAAEVREAVGRGNVFDKRPRGFYVTERSRHGGGGLMPLGQRFVLHKAGDRGWIVSLATRVAGDVDVITTLRRIERTA